MRNRKPWCGKVIQICSSPSRGSGSWRSPWATPVTSCLSWSRRQTSMRSFLRRIPAIQDVQSVWLLLLYCAVPRANYWFRTVQPELTASFAERHDKDVWTGLCEILQINGVGSKVVPSASLIGVCPENPRSRLLGQLGRLPRDG